MFPSLLFQRLAYGEGKKASVEVTSVMDSILRKELLSKLEQCFSEESTKGSMCHINNAAPHERHRRYRL